MPRIARPVYLQALPTGGEPATRTVIVDLSPEDSTASDLATNPLHQRPTTSTPESTATERSGIGVLSPRAEIHRFLPVPVCTLAEMVANRHPPLPSGQEHLYVIVDETMPIYVGRSRRIAARISQHIRDWERPRRHFARLLHVHPDAPTWRIITAPPADCVPLIAYHMRLVCGALDALRVLPEGLVPRIEAILARPDDWVTPHLVEAMLIGILAPCGNLAGNHYGRSINRKACQDRLVADFVSKAEKAIAATALAALLNGGPR